MREIKWSFSDWLISIFFRKNSLAYSATSRDFGIVQEEDITFKGLECRAQRTRRNLTFKKPLAKSGICMTIQVFISL